MIDDAMRGALASALGDRTGTFVQSLYVADWVPRVRAGLDALFEGADADWGIPIEWATEGEPWPLIQRTLVDVARLRELDPVTTEVVRLYQARRQQLPAVQVPAQPHRTAGGRRRSRLRRDRRLPQRRAVPRRKAGLGLAEGLTWKPGHLDPQAIAAVREHFSPAEAVELVLDMMRNSCNKIAVSTGTDQANIADGVEIYDVNPDGSVDFGLALPG